MVFKKFSSFDQVAEEYGRRLQNGIGGEWLDNLKVTEEDLPKLQECIEYMLGTEYNHISGYTFSEIMEGMSLFKSYAPKKYLQDWKNHNGLNEINESFVSTTQAMAPFPILNKGLVLYTYEKTVLPYLAHVFDLKANRGLAYYMQLIAQNSPYGSGVNPGDVIASPITLPKQTTNFITTKITNQPVMTLVQNQASYSIYLGDTLAHNNAGNASGTISIQPQSLHVTIDGLAPAFFQDLSNDVNDTHVVLTNVSGDIGQAVVDINTGIMTIVLNTAPSQGGGFIRATFNRDVETVAGGTNNQAVVAPELVSVSLEAEDFSVFTTTNLYQQRLAQVIFGIDWDAEVDSLLSACYNKEIANKVLTDIIANIPSQSVQTYSMAPTVNTGDNAFFKTGFLPVPINKIHNMISVASGLGGGRKVSTYAASIEAMPLIEALPKFEMIDSGENMMGGMFLAGTLNGIPMLAGYSPILASAANGAQIVGIYKSKEKEFLTAAVVGQFILPVIRNIYDQNNLSTNRKQLISSAATKTVVPNLASQLILTDIPSVL